jgi:hypothetical protein
MFLVVRVRSAPRNEKIMSVGANEWLQTAAGFSNMLQIVLLRRFAIPRTMRESP